MFISLQNALHRWLKAYSSKYYVEGWTAAADVRYTLLLWRPSLLAIGNTTCAYIVGFQRRQFIVTIVNNNIIVIIICLRSMFACFSLMWLRLQHRFLHRLPSLRQVLDFKLNTISSNYKNVWLLINCSNFKKLMTQIWRV